MAHVRVSDLRGYSRLAIDAVVGVTNLVEIMHANIARVPNILGTATEGPTEGVTGLVYESVRGVTRLVGSNIDVSLALLELELGHSASSAEREAVLAHDHGAALAADAGFTPVYLHYKSGLHVSTNGRAFAGQIEALLQAWPAPIEEVVIVGHSDTHESAL